jgi:magnesium-transporting ATPase (P-type)
MLHIPCRILRMAARSICKAKRAATPSMSDVSTREAANREQHIWHAMPTEELASALNTDLETGLSDADVRQGQQRFGANRLTPQSERTALMRFLNQFNNLFIYVLLVAGGLAAALGEWLDGGVIFVVVLIIAIIGFIQEAVARLEVDEEVRELDERDLEGDLVLLGLFGLIDPPREEAIEAVAACQHAGIRVKMMTGDHALTAQAIAGDLGLKNPDSRGCDHGDDRGRSQRCARVETSRHRDRHGPQRHRCRSGSVGDGPGRRQFCLD